MWIYLEYAGEIYNLDKFESIEIVDLSTDKSDSFAVVGVRSRGNWTTFAFADSEDKAEDIVSEIAASIDNGEKIFYI